MWLAGYEYTGRTFNFGARTNVGSPDFRLVGQPETNNVQRQSYVSTGVNLGRAGSIGVAWAEQRRRNLPAFTTAALSYSTMLADRAFLSATVSRSEGVIATTSAFLSVSIPLDARTSVGGEGSTTRAAGRDSSYVGASAQRSAPSDQGFGYRIRATSQQQVDGGLGYRWSMGEYLLEASTFDGARAMRGTATGGIGVVDGHSFMSRRIEDSFGIVRVGDVEGVRVFKDGNPVGRTDRDGVVVLPNLLAYSPNRITIEDRDLPIDASVASRQTTIVPQYRSGALADYRVTRRQAAVVVIRVPDGSFLPAGIELTSKDSRRSYIAGENGEVFVPDVSDVAGFVVKLRNGTSCRVELEGRVPPKETLPVIGPLTCVPAQP
jgi:outer membrane usher protein